MISFVYGKPRNFLDGEVLVTRYKTLHAEGQFCEALFWAQK